MAGPLLRSSAVPSPAARAAALAGACAAIERAFGAAALHARHRQMAKTALRSLSGGLSDTALHIFARRYGELAALLPDDFAGALRMIETRLVHERALHRRYAAGAWYLRPSRTRLAILTEARLILRWLRREGHAGRFASLLETVMAPSYARIAAE